MAGAGNLDEKKLKEFEVAEVSFLMLSSGPSSLSSHYRRSNNLGSPGNTYRPTRTIVSTSPITCLAGAIAAIAAREPTSAGAQLLWLPSLQGSTAKRVFFFGATKTRPWVGKYRVGL